MNNKAKSKSITFTDVIKFLQTAELTHEQHRKVMTLAVDRNKRVTKSAIRTLKAGDRVTWDSKLGYPIKGTVSGSGRTRIYVTQDVTCTRWSVSASLLRKL